MRNFNREIDIGHARIKTSPGASSREFSHYGTPTLEDGNLDVVILNFDVNNLLQIKHR